MSTNIQLQQRAYKFCLAPTPAIQRMFESHAGGARVAYNWGISTVAKALDVYATELAAGIPMTERTKRPKHFDLCKMWTAFKNEHATEPDEMDRTYAWVSQNFVGTYQAALRDAAGAWDKFFDSRKGLRAGRKTGRPKFKSRHKNAPSFQVHGTTLKMIDQSHINLPKIGAVKIPGMLRLPEWQKNNGSTPRKLMRLLRKPPVKCPSCTESGACKICKGKGVVPAARLIRATISRGASGTWWCSVTAEVAMSIQVNQTRRQIANGTIGLDLGTRFIAVDSNGVKYENPQHLDQSLTELKIAQRALSRCEEGSRRSEKARKKVGTIHERVALMRKDSTDRVSSSLARGYALIAVEGWDVQQLAEKGNAKAPKSLRRRRNRQLADAAPGMMRWQLEYKASWFGASFHKTGRNDPTGRTCSSCGGVNAEPVPLGQEMFTCDACSMTMCRRTNAARVVRQLASR